MPIHKAIILPSISPALVHHQTTVAYPPFNHSAVHSGFRSGATGPQLSRTNSELYKCSPHFFNIFRVEFPPFTSPPPLQRCEPERKFARPSAIYWSKYTVQPPVYHTSTVVYPSITHPRTH
ncbi:hypothetical protein T07_1132 [Trichinella nelsoni]|uniref:Uncharacterized protein n=1 Tax=Trichinella nelsoni TaxID=6336 RepID=A0A0V0RIM0_9BILA|nr:hypothetical protein T07_1132 [Trichinella nelsoni]